MSGYQQALEAAGAVVHEFKEFGSYQGDWFARVTYNGETGWIHGYFGSCSGCDSFEAEFGWADEDCDQHRYQHNDACLGCQEAKAKHKEKLAAFGKTYCEGVGSLDGVLAELDKNSQWDSDSKEAAAWIRSINS